MDIKLDSKTILEKEFKTGLRGYNQEEVDLFLDDVIQDYETFKKTIAELRNENARIKEELGSCTKTPGSRKCRYDKLRYSKAYLEFGETCVW